jgi:hypothetical protein
MFEKIKQDFMERFFNFETFKGIYLIPAGALIIYLAIFHVQYLIQGVGVIFGWYWISIGLYKVGINPVKSDAKHWMQVEKRMSNAKPK